MPLAVALSYLIVEALVFWLVAQWIGVGWALVAVFALMVIGGLAGMGQIRSVTTRAARGQLGAARTAGDVGLLMVGTLLAATPGLLTGVIGLFLIIPPTRAFVRGFAAGRIVKSMESFGTRVYTQSPMSKNHTDYGHFTIDEDPNQ